MVSVGRLVQAIWWKGVGVITTIFIRQGVNKPELYVYVSHKYVRVYGDERVLNGKLMAIIQC